MAISCGVGQESAVVQSLRELLAFGRTAGLGAGKAWTAVGMAIALACAEGGGACFLSLADLEHETGLGHRSVLSGLRTLSQGGIIIRERQERGPSRIEWVAGISRTPE